MAFTVTLLGAPSLARDGTPVALNSRKALALLAYLAVTRAAHTRDALATLLWPESGTEHARGALRSALTQLRAAVGNGMLLASREQIELLVGDDVTVDVVSVDDLYGRVRAHGHALRETCAACAPLLRDAVALQREPLLAGFSLPDSPAFDDWVLFEAERLQRAQTDALVALIDGCRAASAPAEAIPFARRWLALDPFADDANRVLIELLIAAGQRSAALRHYQVHARLLREELDVEPVAEITALVTQLGAAEMRAGMGAQRDSAERRHTTLRSLASAAHSNALDAAQAALDEPAPSAVARHNLPARRAQLFGRAHDAADVLALLARDDVCVVTLIGPGGVGKTRLALEVAQAALPAFADGVWLVDLAPISDAELVLPAIAQVLGVELDAQGSPLGSLAAELRGRQLLLVLDNVEQVLAASTQLEPLLAAVPGLKLLATSRIRLPLYGAITYVVQPLALPPALAVRPDGAPIGDDALAALAQVPTVRLFVQRAQALAPGFALSAANAAAVADICIRLDGLPLAIELAAARVRSFAPQALLARLTQLLPLLRGGRDLPTRHQTLRDTIAWSYTHLDPVEQTLFRAMGVFAGGWTLDAAEMVASVDAAATLDGLEALADNSLVWQHVESDGEARWSMLETVREFAVDQLAQTDDAGAVRLRHARYFLALAEGGWRYDPLWIERLATELNNLRAALSWCRNEAAIPDTGGAAGELGVRLCAALAWFWFKRGLWDEGRAWLDWAAQRAERTENAEHQAAALLAMGEVASNQGEFAAGEALLAQSLALYRALGDRGGSARVLHTLGIAAREQNDAARAEALLDESVALFTALDDREGRAGTLCSLSNVAILKRNPAQAAALLDESARLFAELNVEMGAVWVSNHRGHLALLRGDADHAAELQRHSLERFRAYGEQQGIAWALHGLGAAALMQGAAAQAATHLSESLTLFDQLGIKHGVAWCLEGLAGAAWLGGQWERAAWLWGAEEAVRTQLGTRSAPGTFALNARMLTDARATSDAAAFEAAWQRGTVLRLEQILAAVRGRGGPRA